MLRANQHWYPMPMEKSLRAKNVHPKQSMLSMRRSKQGDDCTSRISLWHDRNQYVSRILIAWRRDALQLHSGSYATCCTSFYHGVCRCCSLPCRLCLVLSLLLGALVFVIYPELVSVLLLHFFALLAIYALLFLGERRPLLCCNLRQLTCGRPVRRQQSSQFLPCQTPNQATIQQACTVRQSPHAGKNYLVKER